MNNKKLVMLEQAKKALTENDFYFIELNNGQLQVDGINYWATKGKFYNPKTGEKGEGLNSFIIYLRKVL